MTPRNPAMHGAMYIHTFMERAYRWYSDNGYTMPHAVIRWPADRSYRNSVTGIIFIGAGQEWVEGTLGHEYTHGFVRNFSDQVAADYCNGLCNGDIDGCQHCAYCQETLGTAWSEGFPNFVAQTMNNEFITDYALLWLSLGPYSFETIGACGELPGGPAIDDQFRTEGIFAGFCYDLVDAPADNDLLLEHLAGCFEYRSLTLLDVAAIYDPRYVQDFLDALESHMAASPIYGTQDIENLWETGQNNGYEFDDTVPTVVSNLNSNTHVIGVSSPANLPQFYWNTALDDASRYRRLGLFPDNGFGGDAQRHQGYRQGQWLCLRHAGQPRDLLVQHPSRGSVGKMVSHLREFWAHRDRARAARGLRNPHS